MFALSGSILTTSFLFPGLLVLPAAGGGCPVSVPSSASLPRECRGQQLGPGHAPGLVSFPGHEPPTCSVTRLRPSHG